MNTEVKNAMEKFGLMKFLHVGSNSYPNAIHAKIIDDGRLGKCLEVTYLQLSGWTKLVLYPMED